jgi:predicted O-linked N-acetylglucosamine transferase (SPINDLY family)
LIAAAPLSDRLEAATRCVNEGRLEEAASLLAQIFAEEPDHLGALWTMALACDRAGAHQRALAYYDRLLALGERHRDLWLNRGNTLCYLEQFSAALDSIDEALALGPDMAGLHLNRGNILLNLERLEDAVESYDRALSLHPNYPDAHAYRGQALAKLGRLEAAVEAYEAALETARPGVQVYAFRELCFLVLRLCDWDRVERCRAMMFEGDNLANTEPLVALAYDLGPEADLRASQASALYYRPVRVHSPRPVRRRDRIRLAYLSADFHLHATTELIVDLIESHDRSRFELHAVTLEHGPTSTDRADSTTSTSADARLLRAFEHVHDVSELSDAEAANLIAGLDVDIAIDLKGYTSNCRPAILAARPAPLQVNFLGYPGTLGAAHIDYIIADPVVLPFADQPFYGEHIVQLGCCYQPNDRKRALSAPPPRRKLGLPDEAFVYCCFNNSYKISRTVFGIWMAILRAVDGSVLWLLSDEPVVQANLRAEAASLGVDPKRLVFAATTWLEAHIGRMARADLFLDTLPYGAHTTASEALWAGLPVLTRRGGAFAGRVGASLLTAMNIPDLITETAWEYADLAIRIGREPALARALRAKVKNGRGAGGPFDTDLHRRNIEGAYDTMVALALRGEAPRAFKVEI